MGSGTMSCRGMMGSEESFKSVCLQETLNKGDLEDIHVDREFLAWLKQNHQAGAISVCVKL